MRYKSVFLAVLIGSVLAMGYQAEASSVHGILQVVKGNVQIKSAKDGKTTKAKVGSKIFPKDSIITGKDSRAKIVMVDRNVINVSPDSNLEIQNYEYSPENGKKDVLLNVIYGKVRSKVEQKYDGKGAKFQVKTPTAVAGVRGTDFIASYAQETQASSVITFEGKVEFGQVGPGGNIENLVIVNPGQMSEAKGNSPPPPPQPVPPQQLAAIDKESNAETATGDSDPRAPAANEKKDDKKDDKKDEGKKDDSAKKDAGAKKDDTIKKENGADKNKSASASTGNDKDKQDSKKDDGPDRNRGAGNDSKDPAKDRRGNGPGGSAGNAPGAPAPRRAEAGATTPSATLSTPSTSPTNATTTTGSVAPTTSSTMTDSAALPPAPPPPPPPQPADLEFTYVPPPDSTRDPASTDSTVQPLPPPPPPPSVDLVIPDVYIAPLNPCDINCNEAIIGSSSLIINVTNGP